MRFSNRTGAPPAAGKPRRRILGGQAASGKFILVLIACLLVGGCSARWNTIPIGEIYEGPRGYDGKNVTIRGTVTESVNLVFFKYFILQDETGEIPVITGRVVPAKGESVTVQGEVKEAFSLGDQRLIVIVESGP